MSITRIVNMITTTNILTRLIHEQFRAGKGSDSQNGSERELPLHLRDAKDTSEEYFNGLFELLEKENREPILLWSSEGDADESTKGKSFDYYKQYRWEQNDFNINLIYLTSESKDEYTVHLAYDDKAVDRNLNTTVINPID